MNAKKPKEKPKPAYAFTTKDELHQALASGQNREAVENWLSREEPDFPSVAANSVDKSTYRALSTEIEKVPTVPPKRIFTQWAEAFLTREGTRIRAFDRQFQVRHLVNEAALELCDFWLQQTGEIELQYGKSAKLVNLLLKHFVCLHGIASEDRMRIYRLLDTPLDKFSLGGIRLLAPNLRIPKTAAMGWVKNDVKYREIQDKIRDLCGDAHCPIDYDILTYNSRGASSPAGM